MNPEEALIMTQGGKEFPMDMLMRCDGTRPSKKWETPEGTPIFQVYGEQVLEMVYHYGMPFFEGEGDDEWWGESYFDDEEEDDHEDHDDDDDHDDHDEHDDHDDHDDDDDDDDHDDHDDHDDDDDHDDHDDH